MTPVICQGKACLHAPPRAHGSPSPRQLEGSGWKRFRELLPERWSGSPSPSTGLVGLGRKNFEKDLLVSSEGFWGAPKPLEAPKAFGKETTSREPNGSRLGVILHYTIKCVRKTLRFFCVARVTVWSRPYLLASVPGPDRRLNPPIAARIPVAIIKNIRSALRASGAAWPRQLALEGCRMAPSPSRLV